MKNFAIGISLILIVHTATAQHALPPAAQTQVFLPVPAEVLGPGLFGFENPAMARFNHGLGSLLAYARPGDDAHQWGLFLGAPHLSFSVIRHSLETGGNTDLRRSDFRLATGWGSRALSLGLGLGWSTANPSEDKYARHFSAGLVYRPLPVISFGLNLRRAFEDDEAQYRSVLGWRPLKNDRLTLFAEALYQPDCGDEITLAAGAAASVAPGLTLFGRWDRHQSRLGLCWHFGHAGVMGSISQRDSQTRTAAALYLGSRQDNFIDRRTKKQSAFLQLVVDGPVVYRKPRLGSGRSRTLSGIIRTLDAAMADPRVAGVALRLSGTGPASELAWELRKKLNAVKATGRKVIVFIDRPGMAGMHLASVADRVLIDPEGLIMMPGYGLSRTYLKGLLDRLGIGFEEWRFFPYKSAFENYGRSGMSEPDRVQRQAWLDDLHQLFVHDVSEGRGLSRTTVDSLIQAQGVFLAREAVALGLADTLGRWPDAAAATARLTGRRMALLGEGDLLSRQLPRRDWGERPQIAVVYAQGECATDGGIRARSLAPQIRRLANNSRVKALVLRVDSPGGDGMASDWVAQAVRECKAKKPVVVSQGRVAASGGYWLSMDADTVLAGPGTLTGSIGVIGGWLWNRGLAGRLGLSTDHVKTGAHADLARGFRLPFLGLPLPERNLTPAEKQLMEARIKVMYREFVARVAAGRGLSVDSVRTLAGGRIWSGIDAVGNGLVDKIGGLDDAVAMARRMAGISATEPFDWLELPAAPWFDFGRFMPRFYGVNAITETPLEMRLLKMMAESGGQPLFLLPMDYWSME